MTKLPHLLMLALSALAASPSAFAVPPIKRWTTDGGATVLFVRTTALPIVDIQLTFDAGSARDGDTPGLARLTNNLVLEGTDAMSAGEIARRFEQEGARVSTDSERDMATISLRTLSRAGNRGAVVGHFADVIASPTFPQSSVDRVRQQMLVGLRQAKQSPGDLGERAFARAIYGDHPYASPPEGTSAALTRLGRDEVRDFHDRYYVESNLTLALVGDLSEEAAHDMAARITSGLKTGKSAPALPPVPPIESARTIRIPFDSKQTHVLIGQPAVARGEADYFPLYVANHILGGNGLVSILSEEMREKRGLSYSTYSYVAPAAREGRFVMGTQVRNEALAKALDVLRGTLKRFHDEGPTAGQIDAAKRNITGSFPLSIDSNNDLVGYIAMIGFYGLPLDYLDRFAERMAAIDRDEAAKAFRREIHPDRLITVLVGPESVIGK